MHTESIPTTADVLIMGGGLAGMTLALQLRQRLPDLNVLVLERGKNVEHIKDYVNATKPPWAYPHRGGRTQQMIAFETGIARTVDLLVADYVARARAAGIFRLCTALESGKSITSRFGEDSDRVL